MLSVNKFGESDKLVVAAFQHLDEAVQALHHLASAMVFDDERHLKFRMLLQIVKLPRMEIGDEVAVLA